MKKEPQGNAKKQPSKDISSKREKLLGLFTSELRELLDSEQQLVKALPNMVKAADSPELKEAFTQHLQETKNQVKRLEQIFEFLDAKVIAEPCEAMQGLIQECNTVIKGFEKSPLRDAALITKSQCIEHYEMSIYGTLRSFAKELSLSEAGVLLQTSQEEEVNADKALSRIAEGSLLFSGINRKAND